MSWWTSAVEGVKTAKNTVVSSIQWAWGYASLPRVTSTLFDFTAKTSLHILEEGLAIGPAIRTSIYNPEVRKIVHGMGYVLVNDVIPMIGVNYLNNSVQSYYRNGHEDNSFLSSYNVFLGLLTLGDYWVRAYTMQRGVQTALRVGVLNTAAPPAYNSNRTTPPLTHCVKLECNQKRILKGMGRELFILLANEALIGGIGYIPYGGNALSKVLHVINTGRFITRSVTPNRCERHKDMEQESVLALGLAYEASRLLMEHALDSTVGSTPYIYLRTLRHLLLSWHVNLAAHMEIPIVESKEATLPIDIFKAYEGALRFLFDVTCSGMLARVPIDFKPEKGAQPLIPLSPALRFGTRLLNRGLEREKQTPPGVLEKSLVTAKQWLLPTSLQSTENLVRDPIISEYWPQIRQGGISTLVLLQSFRNTKASTAANWAPQSGAMAMDLIFGVPQKLTLIALMLSREQDFWDLANAIKLWLERHNIKTDVVLIDQPPALQLRGTEIIEELPPQDPIAVAPGSELVPDRIPPPEVVTALQLVPSRQAGPEIRVSANPSALFTTRRRPPNSAPHALDTKEVHSAGV